MPLNFDYSRALAFFLGDKARWQEGSLMHSVGARGILYYMYIMWYLAEYNVVRWEILLVTKGRSR